MIGGEEVKHLLTWFMIIVIILLLLSKNVSLTFIFNF